MGLNDIIQILIEQNQHFKDMMTFAITSIIGILVIFLTANFFTMRKLRNEEKEKIKIEILSAIESNHLDEIKDNIKEIVNSTAQAKIDSLKKSIGDMERKISRLEENEIRYSYQFNYLKGQIYLLSNSYKNAYNSYVSALENCISNSSLLSAYVPHVLQQIEETLENVTFLVSYDIPNFNKVTSTLGKEYETQIEKIKSKLEQINVV